MALLCLSDVIFVTPLAAWVFLIISFLAKIVATVDLSKSYCFATSDFFCPLYLGYYLLLGFLGKHNSWPSTLFRPLNIIRFFSFFYKGFRKAHTKIKNDRNQLAHIKVMCTIDKFLNYTTRQHGSGSVIMSFAPRGVQCRLLQKVFIIQTCVRCLDTKIFRESVRC